MTSAPVLASSDLMADDDFASGGSVGLVFLAVLVGTIAAVASLCAGTSWWMALCLYVCTGGIALLALALRMALQGDDPADPHGPAGAPNTAVHARQRGDDELLA